MLIILFNTIDVKPPENVLFVCKLNPVTDEEDLQLIFSRFDPNARAEIIRDRETGDSLQVSTSFIWIFYAGIKSHWFLC